MDRRFGNPKTDEERRRTHKMLYGNEDIPKYRGRRFLSNLSIGLVGNDEIVTDESGKPLIKDEKFLRNYIEILKKLFPNSKYYIYQLRLKEII